MRTGTRKWLMALCDLLIAVAAVATATTPLLPWCTATLQSTDPGQILNGVLAPQGAVTGLYAHPSLKAVMALAVLQLALLLARYRPGGRLRVVPGYGFLMVTCSVLICLIVAADVVIIPGPWADILSINGTWSVPIQWEGTPVALDGANLFMTWSYGAIVAAAAALASLACVLLPSAGLALTSGQSRRERNDAAIELGQVSS